MAETVTSIKSIIWASIKIAIVLFVMRFLLVIFTNGFAQTMTNWYVEAGWFALIFLLVFFMLVLISRFDKRQVEKEKGSD